MNGPAAAPGAGLATSATGPSAGSDVTRVEDVVRREAPGLLSYLTRQTGSPADAADLLGDVLVVIWRRVDALPADDRDARMWLFGVARRVLSTHRRGTDRRSALTDRLRTVHEADAGATLPAESNDPKVDAVRACLDRLPPADRELVALIHWDGFTVTEAAHLVGARPGAVRSRYHRARLRLRRMVEAELGRAG